MPPAGDLPRLGVQGRHVISLKTGEPVRLRGVNRSGLEYAEPGTRGFLAASGITRDEIAAIAAWGANVIRLPFNQDFALHGRGAWTGRDYLAALDAVVEWAAGHGLYTLLDLQWLDADTPRGTDGSGRVNRVPPLPSPATIDLWAMLASHYRASPSVLFDLFNEPHDPLFDDLVPLVGVMPDGSLQRLPSRAVGMAEWQPWALRLVETIRHVHPEAVIFVSGVRWAFDLRGFPLRDRQGRPVEGLVYSTHVYPWSRTGLVRKRSWRAEWDRAFGDLSTSVPVFVAEWGGEASHVAWGRELLAYLDAREIGWAAWSWADWPHVVRDHRAGDFTPTAFGTLVRDALGGPRHA